MYPLNLAVVIGTKEIWDELQPLLENAIYHGVEPGTGVGDVKVRIERRGERVHAAIENPHAWLRGIARHRCYRILRSRDLDLLPLDAPEDLWGNDASNRPAGSPAGMPSLNSWPRRMSVISREASGETARPSAMARSRTSRSRAVVVLFRPRSNALPSSTPRSTLMSRAPIRRISPITRAGVTRSMMMSVARLLLSVIIRRRSSRTVSVPPTRR